MNFLRSLYLGNRFFLVALALVVGFTVGYIYPLVLAVCMVALPLVLTLLVMEILLLYRVRRGIFARRELPERLSNGDENPIGIYLENFYSFPVRLTVIDELPHQFQKRDLQHRLLLPSGNKRKLEYHLRPTRRGEYHFGALNVFAGGPLGLVERRFRFSQDSMCPVYPSYIQMRKYELMAVSNRLTEIGVKKMRRVGHSMEFDQIRQYVRGDDYRTINWKATARHVDLMVNQYMDERSQQVYNIIDMGRVMKMPFEGMTLLDYAINSALVLSNIAVYKQDRAGIVTFADKIASIVPAERKQGQMRRILEVLYNQETGFGESSYALLYSTLRHKLPQRSLIVLYTNFETLSSMRRQLPYLRAIAQKHLLVTVFFMNTELDELLHSAPHKVEEIYIKTIAEKFAFEKKEIVRELQQYGIHAILTTPQGLTVNTINKYLELKARGQI